MKRPSVYILSSRPYGTLYVGLSSDLNRRMAQHSQGLIEGFSKRYAVKRLVYYEMHDDMASAIRREKRLKRWNRAWKYRLIEQMNPEWADLFDAQSGEIAEGPAHAARLAADLVRDFDVDGSPPEEAGMTVKRRDAP